MKWNGSGTIHGKLLTIGAVIVLLMVSIIRVESLVRERSGRNEQVHQEIAQTVGGSQSLSGPFLVVPRRDPSHREPVLVFLSPDELEIQGTAEVEHKHRGVYDVPVYAAQLRLRGKFSPALLIAGQSEESYIWEDARLVIGLTQPRGIRNAVSVKLNGGSDVPFEPGALAGAHALSGIHAKIPRAQLPLDRPLELELALDFSGSSDVMFVPTGKAYRVRLESPWEHPSFTGGYTPSSSPRKEGGFIATWHIPRLWQGSGQLFTGAIPKEAVESRESFGVSFFEPVNVYVMTDRAIKYELLFTVLTFALLFLFEIFCDLRLHGVHYLLIGGALMLFYFLLLSIAEQLSFAGGYLIATGMVVGLITGYARSVLRSGFRASLIGSSLAALYGYLYILLTAEDYSLLMGSLGLTTLLGAAMYLTRNVDWHAFSASRFTPEDDELSSEIESLGGEEQVVQPSS